MPWCHPDYSIDESRSWLAAQVQAFQQRTEFEFAITSDAGAYLGGCGLNRIDALNQRANLGYWVRSSATGQGVATAAVTLARDWGFAQTDLVRLEVLVAVGNAGEPPCRGENGRGVRGHASQPAAGPRHAARRGDVRVRQVAAPDPTGAWLRRRPGMWCSSRVARRRASLRRRFSIYT